MHFSCMYYAYKPSTCMKKIWKYEAWTYNQAFKLFSFNQIFEYMSKGSYFQIFLKPTFVSKKAIIDYYFKFDFVSRYFSNLMKNPKIKIIF